MDPAQPPVVSRSSQGPTGYAPGFPSHSKGHPASPSPHAAQACTGASARKSSDRVWIYKSRQGRSVLLRFLVAKPTPNEFLGPHPVTACQNNRRHIPWFSSILQFILPSRHPIPIPSISVVVAHASSLNMPALVEYLGRACRSGWLSTGGRI